MTEKEIQNLIVCPKKILKKEPKKGYKTENNHKRCNFNAVGSVNNKIIFDVFIRQNQTFIENFSIGLNCKIPEHSKPLPLIRYNGPHGSKKTSKNHHFEPHIHRITAEEIHFDSDKPQLKEIKVTDKYSIFEDGLRAFLIDMRMTNWKEYFPELQQGRLF